MFTLCFMPTYGGGGSVRVGGRPAVRRQQVRFFAGDSVNCTKCGQRIPRKSLKLLLPDVTF